MIEVIAGDCLGALPRLPADSVDACVTDPPYGLSQEPDIAEVLRHWLADDDYKHRGSGFMGKSWDSFVPGPSYWREVFRVLKPGSHLLCFAGTRTQDLMGIALRMAGFEIRDCIRYEQGREAWPAWFYGTGFPKSHDVSKAIDKMAGSERPVVGSKIGMPGVSRDGSNQGLGYGRKYEGRGDRPDPAIHITAPATPEAAQWAGWGTALKPAYEPILVARKPLSERTVAANVLKYGCGALNLDACRIPGIVPSTTRGNSFGRMNDDGWQESETTFTPNAQGRFPANLIHDGSQEVLDAFAAFGESRSVSGRRGNLAEMRGGSYNSGQGRRIEGSDSIRGHTDSGSAARFFYSAKASKADRMGTTHPTTKPVSLIEYLCRLVTPPGGTVLDPFAGSGTLVPAARRLGINAILIEREPEYIADIERRIANDTDPAPRKAKPPAPPPAESSPTLFDAMAVG